MVEFSISSRWYELLILALCSYLVGCFNFAMVISARKKKDISKLGSGNPGTMNMVRELGVKMGVLTFVCDALKGGVPTLIAYFIYRNSVFAGTNVLVSDLARYIAGFSVIVGHIYPVTMKFKGGKGIASTFGLFWVGLSCDSAWFALAGLGLVLLLLLYLIFRQLGAMASLIGVSVFGSAQACVLVLKNAVIEWPTIAALIVIFLLVALTWFAHRKNLVRLLAGEEHKTVLRKKKSV
ncbi:MAG: glycerol-3-phosphate acyltransferase [Clostridia bacterium]|nr:glycerol-3-phosphate acyltransferase [Clostridia bacterium]